MRCYYYSRPIGLDEAQDPNEDPDAKSNQEESSKPAEGQASQTGEQTQKTGDQKDEENVAPEFHKTSTYSIQSLGHPVGLRATYSKSWIQRYKVEITKPCSWALSSEWHPPS